MAFTGVTFFGDVPAVFAVLVRALEVFAVTLAEEAGVGDLAEASASFIALLLPLLAFGVGDFEGGEGAFLAMRPPALRGFFGGVAFFDLAEAFDEGEGEAAKLGVVAVPTDAVDLTFCTGVLDRPGVVCVEISFGIL